MSTDAQTLDRAKWRQLVLITVGAVAIFVTLRLLPTGTNLSHMDFRAQGKNSIEFCDPLNPQFIPVVEARSPVTMTVATALPAKSGEAVHGVLTLRTSSGKPVAPEDLLVVHTRPLHLMAVDPSLTDYQHLHPEPGRKPGEWTFTFTPVHAGTYRLFGDFTPVATGRGLYASTDLNVAAAGLDAARPPAPADASAAKLGHAGMTNFTFDRDGFRFALTPAQPMRARQPIDLRFTIAASASGRVPLEPVMGAFAHLVAFDVARSGFAHLHPAQADPLARPDATHPALDFKLTIPMAGRYVIWAQVNLAGRDTFAPFWIEVAD